MIFITGATGLIGSALLNDLVEKGEKVRALKRKGSDFSLINRPDQVEWVEGDIMDTQGLLEALQGVDSVIHGSAIVSYHPRERAQMYKINVEGTANVVNMSLDAGVKEFIHISSVAAIGASKGQKISTETTEWDEQSNSHYGITKHLSELEVWRGASEGLNVIVVNPSVVLGAGDWNRSSTKLFQKVYKSPKLYTDGAMNCVDIRDVVNAVAQLREKKAYGERFIINGHGISFEQFVRQVAQVFGKKGATLKVPYLLVKVMAVIESVRTLLLGTYPIVTQETAKSLRKKIYYDNSKIIAEMGMAFTPLDQTISKIGQDIVEKYDLRS